MMEFSGHKIENQLYSNKKTESIYKKYEFYVKKERARDVHFIEQ